MIWTRRDFLRVSALGLIAGAVPSRAALARAHRWRRAPAGLVELRRGVGIFRSRGGTIGWLMNPDGALVVDSQYPDTAGLCLRALEDRGADRLDALVNTHHHGDHTGGNGVFREVVGQIVAHARVPALQRAAAERAGTVADQVYAGTTFADRWTLEVGGEVGGEVVRARHYGPAHTGGDCTVLFERAGIVHMGDLVFNRAIPFIDRPGGASIRGWIRLLETVAAEHPAGTLYIFGHGSAAFGVTGDRADVLHQRDFLAALLDTARRAIALGESRDEAMGLDRLPGFPDHVTLGRWLTLGNALGVAYDELSAGG